MDSPISVSTFNFSFWLKWIIFTAIGYLIGDMLFVMISKFCTVCVLSRLFMGSIVGFSVGLLQWLNLRWQIPRVGWWILASGISWGIGYFVKELICLYMPMILAWAIAGAIIGSIQWIVLQRQVFLSRGSVIWIVANSISIALGYYGLGAFIDPNISPGVILVSAVMLGYTSVGAVTGSTLIFLFQHFYKELGNED